MIFEALLLGTVLFMSESQSPAPPPAAREYRLVFSDSFRNLDLSPDGRGAHTWYEGVWYSAHHAPLSNIASTTAGLLLTWTRGQDQPDTSIATFSLKGAKDHAWRYGYFEVRMKWKPEPGAWPAVWLLPKIAGDPQEMGELDIFEGNAEHPNSFFGTIHHWRRDPVSPAKMIHVRHSGSSEGFTLPPGADVTQFHTYAMLWEPDKVTWYFDGQALHSESAYPVFDSQDYSLIIGMQAGANWQLGNLKAVTAEKMSLAVDWVRVWQK
jgi:hypothetical protein